MAAFDKRNGRVSYVGVRKAARSLDFNRDSRGDDIVERMLGEQVENPAAAVVKQLVLGKPPSELSIDDVLALTRLIAVQVLRGPHQRGINTH